MLTIFFGQFFKCPLDDCAFSVGPLERGMEHPARVEDEREGGTGPRGRDRGGERPPGVAVWVAEGIIRVVLGVADSPCGCGV